MPERVVVDTSALIDAADRRFPDRGETFRYLQGRYPVEAPALIASEAGNVVHRKHPEAFGQDVAERAEVLETLLEGISTVGGGEGQRGRSGWLCDELGLTFYDAEFLELADRGPETVLITQDAQLHEAGRRYLGDDRCLTLDEAASGIAAGDL